MLKSFIHLNCWNSIHFCSAKIIPICVVRTGANEIDFLIGISRLLVCMYVRGGSVSGCSIYKS